MSLETLDIRVQLPDGALRGPVVQLHVSHRGQVDLSAVELADGRPQDPALLAGRSLFRKLKDRVAHESKLGGRL